MAARDQEPDERIVNSSSSLSWELTAHPVLGDFRCSREKRVATKSHKETILINLNEPFAKTMAKEEPPKGWVLCS